MNESKGRKYEASHHINFLVHWRKKERENVCLRPECPLKLKTELNLPSSAIHRYHKSKSQEGMEEKEKFTRDIIYQG
jgi:hypothetical protein